MTNVNENAAIPDTSATPEAAATPETTVTSETTATPETTATVKAPATSEAPASERKARKTRIGVVVSDKMEKTIAVQIERQVRHPLYKKYSKKTKKLLAHDEERTARIGDKVMIMETRPMSKNKCWRLAKIIERAK